MRLDDGTTISFNGAIYNFVELRSELDQRGHAFQSRSDTEVVLRGYQEWGIDGLVSKLRGMFAFAIWDESRNRGYLVRDRLGVKPLMFVRRERSIAFASTVEALRAGGLVGGLEMSAVADFLAHGYISEGDAIFEGVKKLPPATIAEWSLGSGLCERTYWSIPGAEPAPREDFNESVDHAERLLVDATRVRLHADVPVAALLSGGIDSALVCWAARQSGVHLRTYTVSVPGSPTDESSDAQLTARELGIDLEVLSMERPTFESVTELNDAFGEPFAVESALGMLRLSRAVAGTDTRVLLTGDGGDDVFLGYPRHRHLLAAQRIRSMIPEPGRRLLARTSGWAPGPAAIRRPKRLLDYAVGGLPAFLEAGFGLNDYRRRGLLGARFDSGASIVTRARGVPNSDAILRAYLDHDYRTQFVAEYLQKVDGSTMHYGIEARAPFLDQSIWEYAARLSYGIRLNRGVLKAILREIARRRISPRVAFGKKRGFTLPVQRWVVTDWLSNVRQVMLPGVLVREGILQQGALERILAAPEATDGHIIWNMMVLETWLAQRGF